MAKQNDKGTPTTGVVCGNGCETAYPCGSAPRGENIFICAEMSLVEAEKAAAMAAAEAGEVEVTAERTWLMGGT